MDASPEELTARAKTLLNSAGVPEERYYNVTPITSRTTKKGSAALVNFHEPHYLQAAASAVSQASQTFEDCSKPAWLAPNKTRTEMKPNMMTHRLGDHLAMIEGAKGDLSMPVNKKLDAKFIEVGNKLAVYILHGSIVWTAWGASRFSSEERDVATAWAET